MKTVQIPEALFMDLARWHLGEIQTPELEDRIRAGLQKKLDAMAARETYLSRHPSQTKTEP